MSDPMVEATQTWLNATYGSVDGWAKLDVNGETGWDTIYGLRRGLQTELGISPVASGFGPATTAAFESQIGQINANTKSLNLLRLVSGSLWCKGYTGLDFTDPSITYAGPLQSSVASAANDLGLPTGGEYIDVKFMASLMSMDAYVIPPGTGGTDEIREVQQWMNGKYVSRRNFAVLPADGSYSRQIETGLMYALQYEFGMSDDVANGNFGPGTQADLKEHPLMEGDSDTGAGPFLVRLYQGALRFNGYEAPFTGTFDAGTSVCTSDFQGFMELPATGGGDYGTWCALLVSTGDPNQTTTGFDTSVQLTAAQIQAAKIAGYTHVGRYTVGTDKFITSDELAALKDSGMLLFPLHQRYNNDDSVMTADEGRTQGIEALERCRALDLPDNSTVFFSVDYDPVDESITGPVSTFFRAVNDAMNSHMLGKYQIGVYGTRNVCQAMLDAGLATSCFVAGMSTGWSGNMGFRMPSDWGYNQVIETDGVFAGDTIAIDHDVVSSTNAAAIDLSNVTPPPIEGDGAPSATGFNVVYEWVVQAEAACERTLSANNLIDADRISDYILGWLRKPTYWDDQGSGSTMWQHYTPESQEDYEIQARQFCESDALPSLPDVRQTTEMWDGTEYVCTYRDVAHMAATILGYLQWGVEIDQWTCGFGDLGGWSLDLLQMWGSYKSSGSSSDLATYLHDHLGQVNPQYGSFSYSDVAADADGWLLARALKQDPSGRSLSRAMREIYQKDTNERIKEFYNSRFGGSVGNIWSAFGEMESVAKASVVGIVPIMAVAHVTSMPSTADQNVTGQAFADFLSNPHA